MSYLISTSKPKARKDYLCSACEWLRADDFWKTDETITFSEWREIAQAKQNGWRIKKGQIYLSQTVNYDGEIVTFKMIPAMDAFCRKHDIYQEE